MKKLIFMTIIGVVVANSAFAAKSDNSNHSFKTRGDMTDEELAMVMTVRDKYSELIVAATNLDKKLGNAILTSSLGLVMDAGALTAGVVTDAKRAKTDRAAARDLEKLSDEELKKKFEETFLAECNAKRDKVLNVTKEEKSAEENTEAEVAPGAEELSCGDQTKKFAVGDPSSQGESEAKEINREAMVQYLVNKQAGGDSFVQTMNWVRMGAAAGGMATNIASAALLSSAEKDIADIMEKRKNYNIAAGKLGKLQMQAHTEGRRNNPMADIASCELAFGFPGKNDKYNVFAVETYLEQMRSNLKKAKILPIVGAAMSGAGAVAAGIGNAKSVSENSKASKGLSIGATAASGVGAAMSGVSIGVIASNRNKGLRPIIDDISVCEEFLWWDDNGHAFPTEG